ncbi:hypothetical protein Bbelb_096810 [Branchiostoma belcheri]|nr:hypothetical protein Bbelb_096810 [Branchiostoma belcheri]
MFVSCHHAVYTCRPALSKPYPCPTFSILCGEGRADSSGFVNPGSAKPIDRAFRRAPRAQTDLRQRQHNNPPITCLKCAACNQCVLHRQQYGKMNKKAGRNREVQQGHGSLRRVMLCQCCVASVATCTPTR